MPMKQRRKPSIGGKECFVMEIEREIFVRS